LLVSGTEADTPIGTVVTTGDFDGDGNADLVIAHPGASSNGHSENGVGYVFRGPISGEVTPDDAWAVLDGPKSGAGWATSLVAVDVDGDGADELFAGMPYYDGSTFSDSGIVRRYDGAVGISSTDFESYDDNYFGGDGELFGYALAAADADGAAGLELAIGAPSAFANAGVVDFNEGCNEYYYGLANPASLVGSARVRLDRAGGQFLAVGAPGWNDGTAGDGAVFLVELGGPCPVTGLISAAWVSTTSILGDTAAYGTGFGVRMAALDLDNDGSDDLVACNDRNECYVFYQPDIALSPADADAIIDFGSGPLRVANAGRVNRDEYDDLLVLDPDGTTGDAYLLYGDSWSGTLGTADMSITFTGAAADDGLGMGAAGGDVNGDGRSDVVLTAPYYDVDTGTSVLADAGAARLYYGPFEPIEGEMPADEADATVLGDDFLDWVGYTTQGVGDVNCDGVPDFGVGGVLADETTTDTGAVYIFFGPAAGGSTLAWQMSMLSASDADLVFYGDAASDYAGMAFSTVGDFNDDGCDDFAIGAPGNDGAATNAGAVYVFYGDEGLGGVVHSTDADVIFRGQSAGDQFGTGLHGGGDFDADGIADLFVGAPYRDVTITTLFPPPTNADAGVVYVFLGASGGDAWSGTHAATERDCDYRGQQAGGRAGFRVVGDFDWDASTSERNDDLAISEPGWDRPGPAGSDVGRVHVIFRQTGCSGTNWLSAADLTFRGKVESGQLGWGLAAGEMRAYQAFEIAMGAPGGAASVGHVYIARNSEPSSLLGAYDVPSATTPPSYDVVWLSDGTLDSYFVAGRLGYSLAMGDIDGFGGDYWVDGSGGADLVIGAPYATVDGNANAGVAYFVYNADIPVDPRDTWWGDGVMHSMTVAAAVVTGQVANGYAGWSVGNLGDLNQDGEIDVGVGAVGAGSGTGQSYVILSSH
jgi:hypothetical protein